MDSLRGADRRIGGKGTAWVWLALWLGIGQGGIAAASAATLDPALLPKIRAATFEVVQAKPTVDPLSYEKPLPLDQLPYQERNDKYFSIGTAFAIGHNRYVTAGHVLLAGAGSLWGAPQLRDASGHVFAIDKIEQFSLRKDFVVFSLAGQPADVALTSNTQPTVNQVVYSVGNALGTGVVIRDGLYTSDTPEEQEGSWKWMRFSAAASPGNSGGPLLDQNGKVIGVVLMKSANENLNYALPIRELLEAPANQAIIDTRMPYRLDLFDAPLNNLFKDQFALPLDLPGFYRAYMTRFDAYSDAQQKALLARESANLFPRGQGSARLLSQKTVMNGFPSLIVRGSNGDWGRVGESSQRFALDSNGYVDVGMLGANALVHLRRPDAMDAATFYGDAKARMDLVVRTGLFRREFAEEAVKMTSLGKPTTEATHTDDWGRPWRVNVWPLPAGNALVITYALPVPDGCLMLMRTVPAFHVHDNRLDLDALSSFIYATYQGTLAQWKEFLKDPARQPAVLRNIHLDFEYGQRFAYASQRVAFSYPAALQPVTPDNLLILGFRFFADNNRPVWDVGDVEIWKDSTQDDQNNINVQRFATPPAGLDNDLTSHWQKLSQRQYPFNAVARYEDSLMKIDAVLMPAGTGTQPPAVLYTAFYGTEGTQPQQLMKRKLDLLTKDMRVVEH